MTTTTIERRPGRAGRPSRRASALTWLRRVHGWIGLWGALLGLLFGLTGFLLNHRAVLKIPAAQAQESVQRLPLPDVQLADARAMAAWLRIALALPPGGAPPRVREEPSRPVPWDSDGLRQPAHWTVNFAGAGGGLQADWWVGSRAVTVRRSQDNLLGTLQNLHKGVGLGAAWVLLVDTLAGGMALLALTGVALWALMTRRRAVGTAIALAGAGTTLALAGMGLVG